MGIWAFILGVVFSIICQVGFYSIYNYRHTGKSRLKKAVRLDRQLKISSFFVATDSQRSHTIEYFEINKDQQALHDIYKGILGDKDYIDGWDERVSAALNRVIFINMGELIERDDLLKKRKI